MATLLLARDDLQRMIRRRRRLGQDRRDEVWNGVYFMAPCADNFHDAKSFELGYVIRMILGDAVKDRVHPNCNVSDREPDWNKNYRIPDLSIFLEGNPAQNRGSHWFGGPDFALEIVSRGDRSRQKVEFYESVGVRELWILDRKPWLLEQYIRTTEGLTLQNELQPGHEGWQECRVLGIEFQLRGTPSAGQIVLRKVGETAEYLV